MVTTKENDDGLNGRGYEECGISSNEKFAWCAHMKVKRSICGVTLGRRGYLITLVSRLSMRYM